MKSMKNLKHLLLAAAAFFVATSAGAVALDSTIVVAGTTGTVVGDTVTFPPGGGTLELDLALSNGTGIGVQSLGISLVGRVGGSIVDFGDLATLQTFATAPQLLLNQAEFVPGLTNGGGFVSVDQASGMDVFRAIQSVSTTPATGTGADDALPTGGVPVGGNGGQIQVIFTVTDSGTIGPEQVFGDSTAPTQPTVLTGLITVVVPEPTAIAANVAMLAALGFVVVVGRRRSRASDAV